MTDHETDEGERARVYTQREFDQIYKRNELHSGEVSWISAVQIHPLCYPLTMLEGAILVNLPTVSAEVYEVEDAETGYVVVPGYGRVILLNTQQSVMDYDLMSEISPIPDARVYFWGETPYEMEDADIGYYGVWYRDDVYPETGPPFRGELNWYDKREDATDDD